MGRGIGGESRGFPQCRLRIARVEGFVEVEGPIATARKFPTAHIHAQISAPLSIIQKEETYLWETKRVVVLCQPVQLSISLSTPTQSV